MKNILTPLEKRFWAKIMPEPMSGCWLWLGWVDRKGYGSIGLGRRIDGTEQTHRVSWILYRGSIPEGVQVQHKCDTPSCVNPDHLELGTPLQNMEQMVGRGRQRHPSMIPYARRTISVEIVEAIK